MFSVCNITTEVKPVAGLCQRICQDFKTRTRKTLSTYFTISNQYDLSKKDVKELQPVTKIVRLAHLPPPSSMLVANLSAHFWSSLPGMLPLAWYNIESGRRGDSG